ncbi:hypothetical protein AMELA_G00065560 [Ameiurus melas]|uniref:Uncharacterized protein n=1 Tax=Ameiurus melas TaxID=219545 RepID=A0A7J6B4R7_AMEME|nr:hypothetical protein AMELA_G00065560 [Ameiurus melas]
MNTAKQACLDKTWNYAELSSCCFSCHGSGLPALEIKMSKAPAHLREHAIDLLQGGMRTADVSRAINCNVCNIRHLRQCYRETGRTADRPYSGKLHVTRRDGELVNKCLGGRVE